MIHHAANLQNLQKNCFDDCLHQYYCHFIVIKSRSIKIYISFLKQVLYSHCRNCNFLCFLNFLHRILGFLIRRPTVCIFEFFSFQCQKNYLIRLFIQLYFVYYFSEPALFIQLKIPRSFRGLLQFSCSTMQFSYQYFQIFYSKLAEQIVQSCQLITHYFLA